MGAGDSPYTAPVAAEGLSTPLSALDPEAGLTRRCRGVLGRRAPTADHASRTVRAVRLRR